MLTMEQLKDLMTIEEAGAALLRSTVTVRKYIKEGKLRTTRVLGRVLLDRAEVLALAASQSLE